ncbi:DUF2993 domain-containing protein [Sporichthya sp.]|uniref:LmeA family phospholipid-binding protein n=1 Tax=Sporichthya sp. TaxID=65475 RepID=UPI0017E97397|nr:DUF2993 domain-containing protein [Sporichthya sp.]MBA3745073.1 DUF2993 domain-containing protein [Sporichthya sp.]
MTESVPDPAGAAGAGPPLAPKPARVPWSRRRRIATWTSVGVVASGLGLVVLDRGAEIVIERVVAGKVKGCLQTPDRPKVEISGFPLLPDLVRGRLSGMTMTAHDANAQGVRVSELKVEAHGVERKGSGGEMDSLRGSGLVTYDAMSEQAMGMTVSNGGDGGIKISGGISIFSGSATTTPRIEDGELVLAPGQVSTPLFGDVDFGDFPEVRIPIRELPAGVDVELNPTDRGLEFSFDGTDVVLPDDPCKVRAR